MSFKKLLCSVAFAMSMVAGAAEAAVITYNFNNSGGLTVTGVSDTETVSGQSVTIQGWSSTGPGGAFRDAVLNTGAQGIGSCNDNEVVFGVCLNNEVDNIGAGTLGAGNDYVLFSFPNTVRFVSVTVVGVGALINGTDIEYVLSPSGLGLNNATALNTSSFAFTDVDNASTVSLGNVLGMALFLGAQLPCGIGNNNGLCSDDFRISQLVIDTDTRVPEPASLALLGAGLAGLGLARRRRARG